MASFVGEIHLASKIKPDLPDYLKQKLTNPRPEIIRLMALYLVRLPNTNSLEL